MVCGQSRSSRAAGPRMRRMPRAARRVGMNRFRRDLQRSARISRLIACSRPGKPGFNSAESPRADAQPITFTRANTEKEDAKSRRGRPAASSHRAHEPYATFMRRTSASPEKLRGLGAAKVIRERIYSARRANGRRSALPVCSTDAGRGCTAEGGEPRDQTRRRSRRLRAAAG